MKKILVALLCALALCSFGNKSKHFDQKDGDRIEHNRFFVEEVTKDGDAIAKWDENRWVETSAKRLKKFGNVENSL